VACSSRQKRSSGRSFVVPWMRCPALRVEVPAPGEDQDKDPGLPFRPSPRIDGQSGVAEVHLPFTARRYLNPDDRLWGLNPERRPF
jgi:hypothetical protein